MSIVSAIFSSRRPSSRVNARITFFMDNLFAIAFGLGLRFVVDNISNHDFKLTATLVGLWEGVITLHFLKKMPNSIDPYIAYIVRLFIDFLVTENVVKLVLVVVWTGLGMVLADIAPAIWYDVGGHRVWRRFRRDIYYMSRSVPTVTIPPLFPRARVVRFSPVIQPTEISETLSTLSPTAAAPTLTSQAPTTRIVPPTPPDAPVRTRRVPGGDLSVFSETNSDTSSVVGSQSPASASARPIGTSHIRYTVHPRRDSIDESVSQAPSNSVDDSNLSSDASSVSTETPSRPVDFVKEEEIEIPVRKVDKGKGKAVDIDTSGVPIQPLFALPPTPSDSNRPHFEVSRNSFVPTITGMPSIPDFYESALGSDWENIRREEVEEAMKPPTPPEKDFDSRIYDSPPAHFIPPPASSAYEPTPRPSTFDKDLWDDVSNVAPSTPYMKPTSEQRTSRLPQPSISTLQPPEAPVSQPVKKRKSEPPPVPQIPVYGDVWDTERDQMPPPTPSALATTPMFDNTVDLNEEVHPASEPLAPVTEQEQGPTAPTGFAREQQGPSDFSFETDDPWNNSPVQLHDQQPNVPQTKHTAPPTPRVPTQTPPTPQQRSGPVPATPQTRPGTVPSTPQTRPGTVPPTPSHRPSTVLLTPHHPLQPIPPIPPQEQLRSVPPTPGQVSRTVPLTPGQKSQSVPSTPQTRPQTIPPTPHQQSQPIPLTPQQQPQPVPPIPQQPQPVPPTPQQQPQPVPPTPGQKTRTVPPTPLYKTQTIPGTPQQQTQVVPPTPGQQSKTVPSTPLHRAQTPVNKAQTALSTPQHKPFALPPDSPPPQLKPIPPDPIPPTPLEQTKNMPPTPQPPVKTVPSTPQQLVKTVPPTPQSRTKTVPPTPQQQKKTNLPTTPHSQTQNLFDDLIGADLGEGPNLQLQNFMSQQQPQPPAGDLLDLGTGETGGNDDGKKSSEGERGGTGDAGGAGAGESSSRNSGENNGNENKNGEGDVNPEGEGDVDPEGEGDNGGDDVATEIKERNKQAIIIRAQIHELTKMIDELKEEKLRAEGREELDPLSEESTLKEREIQKVERSLEKIKKRAEKRHQAAVESTNQLTIPKTLTLNFESSSSEEAALRLEDILGLMFGPERKSFKLEIALPKGGPGKSVKAAVQKVLTEYGIKSISKLSALNVSVMSKAYTDMITTFRQNHSKETDDS